MSLTRDLQNRTGFALWASWGEGFSDLASFCVSGRARTMKISRRVKELHNLT